MREMQQGGQAGAKHGTRANVREVVLRRRHKEPLQNSVRRRRRW